MITLKKALVAATIFIYASLSAQIKFEPGYFTDNSGKKTEVLIKNVDWKSNPTGFTYKQNETADALESAANVNTFEVGAFHFERHTVQIDRSLNNINQLSTNKEPEFKQETLFLRLLVKGDKLSLYSYTDGDLIRYFYSDNTAAAPQQLVYKKYVEKASGQVIDNRQNSFTSYNKENKQYQLQLYNLMADKGYPREDFQKLGYNKNALVKLFTKYNGTDATTFNKNESTNKFNLKVVAGVGFTSVKADNNAESSWQFDHFSHDFSNKAVIRVGLEGEWIMPFNRNKWALFVSPYYSSYKDNGTGPTGEWDIKYQFIDVPVGIRHYMYLNDNARIFLNATYGFAVKMGDSYIQHSDINHLDIISSTGAALGAGFAYGSLSAEARYTLPRGLVDQGSWNADYSGVNLIIAYKIL